MHVNHQSDNFVTKLIDEAQNVAVIPSGVAGADAYAAAVGLFYMLLDKEKTVSFVYQGKVPQNCEDLIKKERITSNISQRSLSVSVDYSNTPAAKAKYSTQDGVLTINIGPVSKKFDTNRVKVRIQGFDFDLIFVVGAKSLDDLGGTYGELRTEFNNANVVNLDNSIRNTRFGSISLIDEDAVTLSTLVFKTASEWDLVPGEEAAKALLKGMTLNIGEFDNN